MVRHAGQRGICTLSTRAVPSRKSRPRGGMDEIHVREIEVCPRSAAAGARGRHGPDGRLAVCGIATRCCSLSCGAIRQMVDCCPTEGLCRTTISPG
jgi:hypothetical protein